MWTVYDYDVHEDWDFENEEYGSWDNRLLRYRVYDGNPNDPVTPGTLLRTVTYTYYQTGQTSNITVKDEDPSPDPINGPDPAYDVYRDLALYYYRGSGSLWRALWGEFERDQNGAGINYVATAAREFSWDSPRARLTTLDFDRGQSQSNDPRNWAISSTHRTDHVGDSPYRDLAAGGAGGSGGIGGGDLVEYMQYLGTAARQPVTGQGVPTDVEFLHGDLIGSTMTVSDDNGLPKEFPASSGVASIAYTAFGEVLTSAGAPGGASPEGFTRYQYAGAYGYESGVLSLDGVNPDLPPVTLQHVGYRWYQPDIGRFVQRDPIGIMGGLNAYGYVRNNALTHVDPTGLIEPFTIGTGIVIVVGGVLITWWLGGVPGCDEKVTPGGAAAQEAKEKCTATAIQRLVQYDKYKKGNHKAGFYRIDSSNLHKYSGLRYCIYLVQHDRISVMWGDDEGAHQKDTTNPSPWYP